MSRRRGPTHASSRCAQHTHRGTAPRRPVLARDARTGWTLPPGAATRLPPRPPGTAAFPAKATRATVLPEGSAARGARARSAALRWEGTGSAQHQSPPPAPRGPGPRRESGSKANIPLCSKLRAARSKITAGTNQSGGGSAPVWLRREPQPRSPRPARVFHAPPPRPEPRSCQYRVRPTAPPRPNRTGTARRTDPARSRTADRRRLRETGPGQTSNGAALSPPLAPPRPYLAPSPRGGKRPSRPPPAAPPGRARAAASSGPPAGSGTAARSCAAPRPSGRAGCAEPRRRGSSSTAPAAAGRARAKSCGAGRAPLSAAAPWRPRLSPRRAVPRARALCRAALGLRGAAGGLAGGGPGPARCPPPVPRPRAPAVPRRRPQPAARSPRRALPGAVPVAGRAG